MGKFSVSTHFKYSKTSNEKWEITFKMKILAVKYLVQPLTSFLIKTNEQAAQNRDICSYI